ncbi:SDR family oxidoreductase [Kribbella sp. NPDC051718]|uniref:SDR family oxidoreductase n=1 Tax=Kribbella sp. NPDC051718 TaxID=3155168 RepID=UPI003432BBBB
MTKVSNAHVVVTGGSSGIGLATARLLASRGASVSLIARGAARLESAAAGLRSGGALVRTAAVDVSDQAALTAALDGFVADAGPCDVLITAAGLARPGPFLELSDEVFRSMIEVDYFGTLYAIRAVAPSMVARGRGSIVAISSSTALLGFYGYSAYAPAKFAVRGLMEVVRSELKPAGIHVGCVFPPDVDAPQLAEENLYKPAETAAISGTIKPITADKVAADIVRAIDRRRFAVYCDPGIAALSGLGPLFAPVVRRFIDRRVRATLR